MNWEAWKDIFGSMPIFIKIVSEYIRKGSNKEIYIKFINIPFASKLPIRCCLFAP
jgi:hypothetical protein